MAKNVYDNENFFNGYAKMSRSIIGLDGVPEWPSIVKILPKLAGTNVLDLGCGYGWFSRYARENGATNVLAMDISQRMLDKAIELTKDSAITYKQADLEELKLIPNSYDLVYSSLVFHYIENLSELFQTIYDSLKPGAYLVFSVDHPFITALKKGYIPIEQNEIDTSLELMNSYYEERKRVFKWFGEDVPWQHRKISTYINLLIENGFNIKHFDEWHLANEEPGREPLTLLLFSAQKPK